MSLDFKPVLQEIIELNPSKVWLHLDVIKSGNLEHYLNIRKYVKTKKYEGPSKGFVVHIENMCEIIDSLSAISEFYHSLDEEFILPRNEIIDLGEQKELHIVLDRFTDDVELDMRIWVDKQNYSGPTNQGVRLSADVLVNLLLKLSKLDGECGNQGI